MKNTFLIILAFVATFSLKAQERGYIDVSGEAEKRVEATSMTLAIMIEGKAGNALQAQQEVLSKSEKVVQFLKSKSYLSEITTETLQLHYQGYNNSEPHFQAAQRITLKVNDLSSYNSFVIELINAGVTQYYSMGFSVENQADYNQDLITEAFANAKAKATSMAAQAGKEVGEAVIISDQANFDNRPGSLSGDLKFASSGSSMGETIIQLRQVLYVRFLLK